MSDIGQIVQDEENAHLMQKAGRAGLASKAMYGLAPILEKEDTTYHVNKILEQNKKVREAVEEYPGLRTSLYHHVEQTLHEYKWAIYGAKAIDSVDAVATVVELGAAAIGTALGSPAGGAAAEAGVKAVTEPLELLAKIPYVAYYTAKSGDVFAPVYFTVVEALSLLPYAGAYLDLKHLYVNRLRTRLQEKAAKSFLDGIVNDEITLERIKR